MVANERTADTPPPAEDKVVASFKFDGTGQFPAYRHLGGAQMWGDVAVLGMDRSFANAPTAARIVLVDLQDPANPDVINEIPLGHQASWIGIAPFGDKLMLITGANNGNPVFAYQFTQGPFDMPTTDLTVAQPAPEAPLAVRRRRRQERRVADRHRFRPDRQPLPGLQHQGDLPARRLQPVVLDGCLPRPHRPLEGEPHQRPPAPAGVEAPGVVRLPPRLPALPHGGGQRLPRHPKRRPAALRHRARQRRPQKTVRMAEFSSRDGYDQDGAYRPVAVPGDYEASAGRPVTLDGTGSHGAIAQARVELFDGRDFKDQGLVIDFPDLGPRGLPPPGPGRLLQRRGQLSALAGPGRLRGRPLRRQGLQGPEVPPAR